MTGHEDRVLVPHDGAHEVFVCRDCMEQIDPVGSTYPGWTNEQCADGVCPYCGGTDTNWLFKESTTNMEDAMTDPVTAPRPRKVPLTRKVRRDLILLRDTLIAAADDNQPPTSTLLKRLTRAQEKDYNAALAWIESFDPDVEATIPAP